MINKKKKKKFFGLMLQYRGNEFISNKTKLSPTYATSISFKNFKKYFTPLLSLIYVFKLSRYWLLDRIETFNPKMFLSINYYAELSRINLNTKKIKLPKIFFQTLTLTNIVSFSKPKKQIFLVFFKKQPVFIFTCGLMRFILNEKTKSSKKQHKVATSLIKLATILLIRKKYFDAFFLKLTNLGSIRLKILKLLQKNKFNFKTHYVIIKFSMSTSAQKFRTRRAIKKYIKKRFKIR